MLFTYDDETKTAEFYRLKDGEVPTSLIVPGDRETLEALYDLILLDSRDRADKAVEGFRLAVENFMMEEVSPMIPDWEDAPIWANFVAMDQSGKWYWYERLPYESIKTWEVNNGRRERIRFLGWTATMEPRPEEWQ